jgi:protein TonB
MSPRTPASIVLGTLVTVSLFGLMQSLVHEPESYPIPPAHPLDPFITAAAFAPLPATIERQVPQLPEQRSRPEAESAPSVINVESGIGPGSGIVLPPMTPGMPSFVDGGFSGRRGTNFGGDGACSGGEAQPRLLVTPDYPRAARAAGIEGEVEVAFTVTADGRVLDAEVVKATPRGAFEAATLRAVRRWRFEAASADCPRADAARRETVSFRLDGIED